jgi:hypothetical protein
MNFEEKQKRRQSKTWWFEKRLEYNLGLIFSGVLAFFLYVFVVEFVVFNSDKVNTDDVEITIFTIIFQSIGYLFMIAFANIVFYGVSGSEFNRKSENILKSRIHIYKTLFWISCCIPFLIPLFLFFKYI